MADYNVVALGPPGAGKTVYLAALHHWIDTRGLAEGIVIGLDYAQELLLKGLYDEVANRALAWPPATRRSEPMREFEHDPRRGSPHCAARDVLEACSRMWVRVSRNQLCSSVSLATSWRSVARATFGLFLYAGVVRPGRGSHPVCDRSVAGFARDREDRVGHRAGLDGEHDG
jgi:hypothetical protein